MKKLISAVALIVVLAVGIFALVPSESQYIRIHIRANSNSALDQSVKYAVKNAVVEYLSPKIGGCTTKEQAMSLVKNSQNEISRVATAVLVKNGYSYTANAVLKKEEFPARTYEETTLEAGVYDALIVELGEAKGDNWWCVLFPPLCFVPAVDNGGNNIEYRSKIFELLGYYGS